MNDLLFLSTLNQLTISCEKTFLRCYDIFNTLNQRISFVHEICRLNEFFYIQIIGLLYIRNLKFKKKTSLKLDI